MPVRLILYKLFGYDEAANQTFARFVDYGYKMQVSNCSQLRDKR